MPNFGDCSTEKGLKALNDHLATRSYVEGYAASAADAAPFAQVGQASHGLVTQFANVTRWYQHIKSYPEFAGKAAAAAAAAPAGGKKAAPAPAKKEEEDDDIDLFGSDDEEEEAARKAAAEKKKADAQKGKKKVIGKSTIILDVKPWDDETDMKALEAGVRAIEMKGLTWGWSKLVPVGYGIKKLQINCVVVDDDVSVDDLEDNITALEDYVQSMDVFAFNKI